MSIGNTTLLGPLAGVPSKKKQSRTPCKGGWGPGALTSPAKTRKGGRAPGAPVWALSIKKVEVYFQLKRLINKHEKGDLRSKFCSFDRFEGSFLAFLSFESRILNIFKLVLELFRKCLCIVFGLKRPTLGVFLALKFDK